MDNHLSETDQVAITSIGMVTSLGFTAPSSIAAILSGIANFSLHESVLVSGNRYGTELVGARIARLPGQILSRRIEGAERAANLLAPAVHECLAGIPCQLLPQVQWRISSRPKNEDTYRECLKRLLHQAAPASPLQALLPSSHLDPDHGRCAFFENIIQAAADLQCGASHMVLVGCSDSLCERSALNELLEADRLKSGSNPEGLIAGEAAGAILLELESHARQRNAGVLAFLSAWGRGIDPNPRTGATHSIGGGLTNAFHEAFALLPARGDEIDLLIADLTGEEARSRELALSRARVFPTAGKQPELKHPADCTGDCGDAMGIVLVATAVGFMSRELPPLHVALSTSDDAGACRVLCLQRDEDIAKPSPRRPEENKHLILVRTVIDQHCLETGFLWLQRNRISKAPHSGLYELTRHDERIQANLEGLGHAGEAAWKICMEALDTGSAGEIFAASVLAFKSGDENRIGSLLDMGVARPALCRGIISALGWLPYPEAAPHIGRLLGEQAPDLRRIGIAASAIHRIDPGRCLDDAIVTSNHMLRARALKAAGELGRLDLLPAIVENLSTEDDTCRFFAAWASALLGDKRGLQYLQSAALSSDSHREQGLKTAFRIMETQEALRWHAELSEKPATARLAIIGAGTIGDPVLVLWLIEKMEVPVHARAAGEAFTQITGADISTEGLKGRKPDSFKAGPTDDPNDDNVAMNADDDLPWPGRELVRDWWRNHESKFTSGIRYRFGKPVSGPHLHQVLCTGNQRARAAAAEELVLTTPGTPLFETRAPGFRQLTILRRTLPHC